MNVSSLNSSLLKGRETGDSLKLVLPQSVRGIGGGGKFGKNSGSSVEFQDHREYKPGDDIRRIDWRAFARSDKYVLKLYREEIQPTVSVINDVSASMLLPSEIKLNAAVSLAGIFMSSAINSECAVSWWTFGNGMSNLWPLSRFFPEKAPDKIDGTKTLAEELSSSPQPLPRHGLKIVISDFLWQDPPSDTIHSLMKDGCALIMICVLCQEEIKPALGGIFSLSDSEKGGRLDIEIAQTERDACAERISTHLDLWKETAVKYGAVFQPVKAEDIISGEISDIFASGAIRA
jgi:hypothetical protein